MNIMNLNFNIKPFNIDEGETKCINVMNFGLFKITINKTLGNLSENYEVLMHNTTGIHMFDPVNNYNYWMKRFDNLESAKQFAEVMYILMMNKLICNFKEALNEYLEVTEDEDKK